MYLRSILVHISFFSVFLFCLVTTEHCSSFAWHLKKSSFKTWPLFFQTTEESSESLFSFSLKNWPFSTNSQVPLATRQKTKKQLTWNIATILWGFLLFDRNSIWKSCCCKQDLAVRPSRGHAQYLVNGGYNCYLNYLPGLLLKSSFSTKQGVSMVMKYGMEVKKTHHSHKKKCKCGDSAH